MSTGGLFARLGSWAYGRELKVCFAAQGRGKRPLMVPPANPETEGAARQNAPEARIRDLGRARGCAEPLPRCL